MQLSLEPRTTIPEGAIFDWATTPLSEYYDGCYLKVLDDVFTDEECAALIALAESDKEWSPAFVNFGLGPNDKFIDTEYRNSERILRFDHEAAEQIYKRLLPYVPELVEVRAGDKWESVVGTPAKKKGVWKLVGVNERLSFLRYGPGQFFREHVDTQLDLPDGRKSRVTIQIYLGEDGVEGGATRIRDMSGARYFDVEPKKGRVLIFQQKDIWHSGQDVVEGSKEEPASKLPFFKAIQPRGTGTAVRALALAADDLV
ncbi:hypothetical protein D9611_010353 [Ephemerocybe angulata]|uniref:Prolyl 4-hydroxylase alpha subunit domain-containing protein n=1 Tax=Ephemerocybe angulata TaxID=980116 RepID=A0A8H5F1I2_9AGAR|nr:hypothetical protein D9611_010353 [Tulosesus angulatus]